MNNSTNTSPGSCDIHLSQLRSIECRIIRFAVGFLFKGLLRKELRGTKHYQEWFRAPLNYARIMEIPLTLQLLGKTDDCSILDVSSPKLAALYLSCQKSRITTSDLEEYFVEDFIAYKRSMGLDFDTVVFDAAARIPYDEGTFDKAFSISVLEHIPANGDRKALLEILRVLKPAGSLVITLPAFREYVEEWTIDDNYWKSVQDQSGKTFFQRRYDRETLMKLVETDLANIESVILIAEHPLKEPELSSKGVMMHNSYLIGMVRAARAIRKLERKLPFLPLMQYLAERVVSKRCHYLTTDWSDPNIRQVAVKLVKK